MRSSLRTVSAARTDRLTALFAEAEAVVGDLSAAGELLEAIARTARLDALLRARYGALESSAMAPPATAPPKSPPRYLDASGAADYLGISRSTVQRLAKAGALRSLRPSEGIVRFDRADLDAYMEKAPPRPASAERT